MELLETSWDVFAFPRTCRHGWSWSWWTILQDRESGWGKSGLWGQMVAPSEDGHQGAHWHRGLVLAHAAALCLRHQEPPAAGTWVGPHTARLWGKCGSWVLRPHICSWSRLDGGNVIVDVMSPGCKPCTSIYWPCSLQQGLGDLVCSYVTWEGGWSP